jgi:uncharacterized membrane protein YjjB (DUF3815 family)
MVQISAQPLFHFLVHLFSIAPILTFVAVLAMMLPGQFAARAARKLVPATVSALNRNKRAAGIRNRNRRPF